MIKLDYSKSRSTRANIKLRALEELWERGDHLERILDTNQMEMYKQFHDFDRAKYSRFVFLCSRRLGKTVLSFALCDEICRKEPGVRVLFLSKTDDNLKEIIDQASTVFFSSCPPSLKPQYRIKDKKFVYSNGSEIRLKGMDKAGPDSVRGVKAKFVVLDEFCFMDNLTTLIKSSVGPMINDEKGRILMISSSPDTPGHDSINFITEAERFGALIKKTIYDCPRWSESDREEFARDAGGYDSDTFRREYLCEIITERNRAILPACTEQHMEKVVAPYEKPDWYDPDHYISIDPGGRDQTAILYAYYDYPEATLVIEDEAILNTPDTETITKTIKKKLETDWNGIKPHKIIMDNNNLILVKDMQKLHGMSVRATKKDKKEAQVNNTNIMMQNLQISINPRCVNLIQQCRYGIWNKTRTSYERTEALSHCDAVDALVYLVRNISRSKNPIQETQPDWSVNVFHGTKEEAKSGNNVFKKLFGRR